MPEKKKKETRRSGLQTTRRPHWSYSQIAQFIRCPLQFYFERIAGLPRKFIPSGMAFGRAIHTALEQYHRHLQMGHNIPKDFIQEAFRSAWQILDEDEPIQYRFDETSAELIDQGTALIDTYLKEKPPENIVAVEQMMTVPLHNSRGEFLEKPLVAVVDLLLRDQRGLNIVEFKTSKRKYGKREVEMALQATCYVNAVAVRPAWSLELRSTNRRTDARVVG